MHNETQLSKFDLANLEPVEGWEFYEEAGLRLKRRKIIDPPIAYWEVKGANLWHGWRLWWRETQIVWELFILWLLVMSLWLSAAAFLTYRLIVSISGH